MEQQDLSALTDQELLQKKKKRKSVKIINAALIGFCIGIILWSVVKNTWGLLMLIPIYIIYKVANQSKADERALEATLKERGLT